MTQSKDSIVVDATVISHALTPNQTEAYSNLFGKLEKKYQFTVSGFTRFELLRTSDKEHREKYKEYIRQDMASIDLSRVLMDFAARLNYLYTKHRVTKGKTISDGDIINAAVAIIKDCPVLTHDSLDYPAPFFRETDRETIQYKSTRDRDVIEMVYLQQPDVQHIKYCFEEHGA